MKDSWNDIRQDEKLLIEIGRGEDDKAMRSLGRQRDLTTFEIQKIVNDNPDSEPLRQMIIDLKARISRLSSNNEKRIAKYKSEIDRLETVERSLSLEITRLKKENALLKSK